MAIFRKIDFKKIQKDGNIKILFYIWLFFSIITTFAFYFQIRALSDVDVPTHIGAGLVIAAFIFTTVKVQSGKQALALAFIPFILWEFIELGITYHFHDGFLFRLFYETLQNKTQDVVMDTLGFLVFMKMTGRRF